MIAFKVENGDLQFKNNDLILLEDDEKAKQDILELIKHIKGTYKLRKNIGIPWFDYIGKLKNNEREQLIITYMYDKVANYKGVELDSISIEKTGIENRKGMFKIDFNYSGKDLNIETEGKYLNE
jgi:hypothetical protein|nr:MAG TPA: hypothetical protein [Caudoviricetes sp.]